MTVYTNFVGIDIGKYEIVVGLHGLKSTHSFANTAEGFDLFYKAYEPLLENTLVVLETTGGYEKLFLKSLLVKEVCVHRANTRHVKAFSQSLGCKGKTDALDALLLARYGYERQDRLPLYRALKDTLETLQSLAGRRLDLNQILVAEKNRLQAPCIPESIKSMCKAMITVIQEQLDQLRTDMQEILTQNPQLREKQEILKTIPGIGEIIASLLVVLLPELGHANRRQIASLTGLAPHPNESGTKIGYRRTKGGRHDVKKILFMAGMAAAHSKSRLGNTYKSMLERGKKKMVALIALMRKIIVIANARIKEYFQRKETLKEASV